MLGQHSQYLLSVGAAVSGHVLDCIPHEKPMVAFDRLPAIRETDAMVAPMKGSWSEWLSLNFLAEIHNVACKYLNEQLRQLFS